ncbi:MAG: hypothetical protein AUG81_12870 [Verrucomicrobia bacterium 13_1_20CM_4_54_11]|nr:MAG: hypothetical protein AUG81_12870 [Verrucomicrobia bacterium 13_1_20CM_4_54_11]
MVDDRFSSAVPLCRNLLEEFSRPGSTARNISPLGLRDNAITRAHAPAFAPALKRHEKLD